MQRTLAVSAVILMLIAAPRIPQTGSGQFLTPPYGEAGACAFLAGLYNSHLQLLAEKPGSRTYYVTSDNLLVGYVLTYGLCQAQTGFIGQPISAAVYLNSCCNHGNDGMHEVLLYRSVSLPIHNSTRFNVTNQWSDPAGNFTVYYEDHNSTGILDDAKYGDVAAYTAMELENTNGTKADREIDLLQSMYNGRGIHDYVYTNGGPGELGAYQTYKLALYILALIRTGRPVPQGLEGQLLRMQSPVDGVFYTGYDANGVYPGAEENVETTSIAMLALRALPGRAVTIVDTSLNITGSTFHQATLQFESLENWTRSFSGSAYLDRTNIDNKTLPSVFPGSSQTMSFTRNTSFSPWACHSVTITIGGTSTSLDAYCPWWLKYWYLLVIPIGAIPVLILCYRRLRRDRS